MSNNRVLLAGCVLCLALAAALPLHAADKGVPEFNAADAKVLVPCSDEMLGACSATAAKMAENVGGAEGMYGFATGISEERGSFRLGVLMTDVNVSVAAGDKGKAAKAMSALISGLVKLGAPTPMLRAFMNAHAAMARSGSVDQVGEAVMDTLRPFAEDFVRQEGNLAYLQLGEWCQTFNLAAAAADEESLERVRALLAQPAVAQYFSETFAQEKDVPDGVRAALDALGQLEEADIRTLRDVRRIRRHVEDIIGLMA